MTQTAMIKSAMLFNSLIILNEIKKLKKIASNFFIRYRSLS